MIDKLDRFITAQVTSYQEALKELKNGKKTSHWMWYTFPHIKGLGKTEIARRFEISDIDEACDYLQHEILGKRLLQLTEVLVTDTTGKTAEEIFGYPDFVKLHSCLTLFDVVVKKNVQIFSDTRYELFEKALIKYYDGKSDRLTLNNLEKM